MALLWNPVLKGHELKEAASDGDHPSMARELQDTSARSIPLSDMTYLGHRKEDRAIWLRRPEVDSRKVKVEEHLARHSMGLRQGDSSHLFVLVEDRMDTEDQWPAGSHKESLYVAFVSLRLQPTIAYEPA